MESFFQPATYPGCNNTEQSPATLEYIKGEKTQSIWTQTALSYDVLNTL